MSAHTPGPWTIGAPHKKAANIPVLGCGRPRVATVYSIRFADSPEPDEECAANARLIAAAPDLLHLLTQMRDYMSDIPESAVGGDDYAISLCRKASAAIAKAEGKS